MTSTFWPASASATARLQRRERLARAALRAEHADEPAVRPLAPRSALRGARAIALLIAKRSCSFVCGKSAMSAAPASNARRRNPFGDDVDEHDDRHVGGGAVGAVDDLERPVVLAALAGDEEDVDLAALQRADRLVDAVRHPDELEVRVVGQGPLDVEGVEAFDGDECADGAFHRLPTCLSVDLRRGARCS